MTAPARRSGRRRWPGRASPPRCAAPTPGAEVTLFEATAAAGRSHLLVPARRPGRRQRPARVPALLHGVPGLLDRLGVADQVTLQDRLDIPVRAPGLDRAARLRRDGCPRRCTSAVALARIRLLDAGASGCGSSRAALALRRLDRTDPAVDARSLRRLAGRARAGSRRPSSALWDLIGIATLNAAGRRRPRSRWPRWCSRSGCSPSRRGGRHRLGAGAAAAAARRRGRRARWTAARRRPCGPDARSATSSSPASAGWTRGREGVDSCGRRGPRGAAGGGGAPRAGRQRSSSSRAGPRSWARRRSSTCTSSSTGAC